ncbi:MAG: hypothetical protein NDJ89_02125 [Oligoflexia bacterium]|nr:hypothetical protein [Oligoflexia bacterium]
MRWNCPHCGISLAVSDDKMGAGWSFSRCYKCGGFALIRRAEVNLVKVDRAPAGEHIILPEATEDPVSSLSEEAARNLARLRGEGAPRNVIRPGTGAAAKPANVPPAPAQGERPLPPPLPELPEVKSKRPIRSSLLSAAITLAAVTTLASGGYLYLQGKELWERNLASSAGPAMAEAPRLVPARATEVIPAPGLASEITDQVHHKAMAPVRTATEPASPAPANSAPGAAAGATLVVQAKAKGAELHSGPGSLYPTIGRAEAEQRLLVADWNDRWFKVVLDPRERTKTAWIRTDLVQVVPPRTDEKLPDYP